MKENELAFYAELLSDITARIRQGQQRAALSVNAELILTYWDVGRMIAERQSMKGWGAGVIPRLALDLKNDLPEQKGFSERNIGRMIAFFREYPNLPLPVANLSVAEKTTSITAKLAQKSILPPSVAQLENANVIDIVWRSVLLVSWSHNVILIQKIKDLATRIWYARQAAENGWSRDVLTAQIKSDLYDRQGAAVTNFDRTLTNVHAAIANGLLKDPYMFDFLTMEEHFHERELETGLLTHIEKFLLELGRGFAFVGRQYELTISGAAYESSPRRGSYKSAQGRASRRMPQSAALGHGSQRSLALKGRNNDERRVTFDRDRQGLFRPFRAWVFPSSRPRAALRGCRRFALPWADLLWPFRPEVGEVNLAVALNVWEARP